MLEAEGDGEVVREAVKVALTEAEVEAEGVREAEALTENELLPLAVRV